MKKAIIGSLITLGFALILTTVLWQRNKKSEPSDKDILTVNNSGAETDLFLSDSNQYIWDGKVYDLKVCVEGKSNNALKTSYYIVLTNRADISFGEVDRSFWSSDLNFALGRDFVIVENGYYD